jgi:hypothetical protein
MASPEWLVVNKTCETSKCVVLCVIFDSSFSGDDLAEDSPDNFFYQTSVMEMDWCGSASS